MAIFSRLDATAEAIAGELFFRRYGTLPAEGAATGDDVLARALARVALMAADGDHAALERLRQDRAATAARLLAEDVLAVGELCA